MPIIMLLLCFVFVFILVFDSFKRRKEEQAIPKPIDNNIYRVVKTVIEHGKEYYVLEKYYYCEFNKRSYWNYVERYDNRDEAVNCCKESNDQRKRALEESQIKLELENSKNKQVII